jgi:hypothetical protein
MSTATKGSSKTNTQKSTKGEAMTATTQIISSSKREAVNDSDFSLEAWEQKLYEGEKFSTLVEEKRLFELWREGANFSEVAFQNYQQALLSVLQHIYCYSYQYEKEVDANKQWMSKEVDEALEVFEKRDNEANEGSTFFGKGDFSQKLIKLAFAEIYLKGKASEKRSLQKRISTYGSVINNALTQGTVSSQTDAEGKVEPKHFFGVVLAEGGIAKFSRKSQKQIALEQQLKEGGYDSVEEKTVAEYKRGIIEERLVVRGSIAVECDEDVSLQHCLRDDVRVDDGLSLNDHLLSSKAEDWALVVVRKETKGFVAERIITETADVDAVLFNDSERRKAQLKQSKNDNKKWEKLALTQREFDAVNETVMCAMERGYSEKRLHEFFAEFILNAGNQWTFKQKELKSISIAQGLLFAKGGIDTLIELYGKHFTYELALKETKKGGKK